MVLLLVIAILVLLAIMGSVYVLMAGADRQSTNASRQQASVDMAQNAVLQTVRGLMLNQTLDQNATIPGTLAIGTEKMTSGVPTNTGFMPDTTIARTWDTPETGTSPLFFYSGPVAGLSTMTQQVPTEPWLVSHLPYERYTYYIPGQEVFYYIPGTTSKWIYEGTANSFPTPPPSISSTIWGQVPASPRAGIVPLVSTISPMLYDPSPITPGNMYDLNYSYTTANATTIKIPNASVVQPRWQFAAYTPPAAPVAATGAPSDAMWNILPFSGPNGTYYRYALRVIDLSSRLNLNTGWIPSADTSTTDMALGAYGTYTASCPILSSAVNANPSEPPADLQFGVNGSTGRGGSYPTTSYSLPSWQSALYSYETQATNGTYSAAFFGLNTEQDFLTGGFTGGTVYGMPIATRPSILAPSTFGTPTGTSIGYGSGYRGLYTTYSWSRNVAPVNQSPPVAGSPGVLAPGMAIPSVSGTTAPPVLNLNERITASNLQPFAQSLYNTLVACGYNPQHACDFLVNYFTYRYTGYSNPAYLAVSGTTGTLYANGSTASITVDSTVVSCLGTCAQPYINEVDFSLNTPSPPGPPTVKDWAVEIVNPFSSITGTPLPTGNYVLQISGSGVSTTTNIPLTTNSGGVEPAAELGSFVNTANNAAIGVICQSGGTYNTQAKTDKDGLIVTPSLSVHPGMINIELIRTGVTGAPPGPTGNVVVDSMTLTIPASISITNDFIDVSRNNVNLTGLASGGQWGCDSSAVATKTSLGIDPGTIGTFNNALVTGNPGIPLYDRFYYGADQFAPSMTMANITSLLGDGFVNIDDFNCIARESTTGSLVNPYPLSSQIGSNTSIIGVSYNGGIAAVNKTLLNPNLIAFGPKVVGTTTFEAYQAALYFDFAYDPRAAFTVADSPTILDVQPTILSMTDLVDRATAPTSTTLATALPNAGADLVRLPGKVNINTAGQDVLYSLFSEDVGMGVASAPPSFPTAPTAPTSTLVSQYVADVVGFRNRLAAGTSIPTVSLNGSTAIVGPDNVPDPGYNLFAGTGFRSNGDLLLALIPTIAPASAAITSIQQRDAVWADVENTCDVRSDTFAVYGYIQALRLNPNYTSTVPAGIDWYNANQGIPIGTKGSIATSSSVAGAGATTYVPEFILEGQRRFIAIIDRSYCNNGAVYQPRIVALKVLP